jgi:hypothetical protein
MTPARSNPLLAFSPLLLLASFCLFWFADTVADPDLWGHLRFGQDILRTGLVVQTDTYSYRTEGQPWINHEWLSEVIFADIYNRSGAVGLIGFKVLVSLLIFGLGCAHLAHRRLVGFPAVLLLILVSIPFRMGLGTVRPQIFTYLLFILELLVLERTAKRSGYRLWIVPILFAVWVNLHGGVIAGVGVLALWMVGRLADRLGDNSAPPLSKVGAIFHAALVGVASGLALLCNPYRAELVRFLWRTATVPRPEITEWEPLGLMSMPGLLYLILLAIGLFGLISSRRNGKKEAILILSVTALLPLISNRHYPLFALSLIVLGGEHIADTWNRQWTLVRTRLEQRLVIPVIIVAISLVLIALSPSRFGCIRIEPFYFAFPARAVAFLKDAGVRGNMAVPFNWGEYVLWHLGPNLKVSMDGRRETAYSDDVYRQSLDFDEGKGAWDSLLKHTRTDLVLARNGSPLANLMSRMDGWLPLYQDTYCVVFIRAGFPNIAHIMETPVPVLPDNGDNLCFPGAVPGRDTVALQRRRADSRWLARAAGNGPG